MSKTSYGFSPGSGGFVEIDGLEETILAFDKIVNDEANAFVVAASKEAADVVLQRAKQYVPVGDSGALRDSLQVKRIRARSSKRYSRFTSQPVHTVGPRYVSYRKKGGVNYGHLVELGHTVIAHRKDVGEFKGKPYLRPAADNSATQVEKILISALDETLKLFGDGSI